MLIASIANHFSIILCVGFTNSINNAITAPLYKRLFGLTEPDAIILIPVFVTILTFALAQFISWIVKKIDKRKSVKAYRGILEMWCQFFQGPLIKQIDAFSDFAKRIVESSEMASHPLVLYNLSADKIHSIPIELFVDTIVINSTGKNRENYNIAFNLTNQLSFLLKSEAVFNSVYKNYQEEVNSLIEEWNNHFKLLDSLQSQLPGLCAIDKEYIDFTRKVKTIMVSWLALNPRDDFVDPFVNLIDPLSDIVYEELRIKPANQIAFQLSAVIQDLRVVKLKFNKNNQGYSSIFNQYSTDLSMCMNNIKNIHIHLKEKTRVRMFFCIK